MTPRHFAWSLRARGPEIPTWPLRERLGALALLRSCAASREILAEALASEEAPPPDVAALDRVTCPVRRALAPLSPLMRGVSWAGLVACLAAGLYLGAANSGNEAAVDLLPVLHPSMPATVLAALDP
jgi:hypothetical protein